MNVEGKANRSDYGSDMRCKRNKELGVPPGFLAQTMGRVRLP